MKKYWHRQLFVFTFILFILILIILGLLLYRSRNFKEIRWGPMQNERISLHPYFGFALPFEAGTNDLGFYGPIPQKNTQDYTVAVFGGSVALNYYYYEKDNLLQSIEASGISQGKHVKVYSFAMGGFKQPQQLFALTYLYMLGYKFDLVVNIDGFNEVAVAYGENYKHGISTYYPRIWNVYSRGFYDKRTSPILVQIETIKSIKRKLQKLPTWLSAIPDKIINIWYSKKQNELMQQLDSLDKVKQTTGPQPYITKGEDNIIREIIDTWFRSAVQMDTLVKEHGGIYLELLQPNQYVPNTKVFTSEESRFVNKKSVYAESAQKIYPRLIEESTSLLNTHGVNIIDATKAFTTVKKQIYIDDCCHYTPEGYGYLTPYILNAL